MKQVLTILLTACVCSLSSLAQDCVTPASISSGTPLIGEATCGTGVLLPDNVCSATYDADAAPEEAKVYSYTTGVTAEDITVAMSNITDTWSGVSMVSGPCGDTTATCLGFYATGSGTADGGFTAVGVPASTTVYIYVTNWPTPNCIASYDLSLTAVTAAVCGDASCDGAETFATCPDDCPVPQGATCQKAITVASGDTIFGAQIITGAMSQDTICNIGDDEDATWYKFTAPADGFIDVESTAGGDTYLNILSGGCANLTCVAQNDDGGVGLLSLISDLPVTAGTVYRIEWDNRWTSGANPFDFVLTFSLPPTCPAPTGLSATADSTSAFVIWTDLADAAMYRVEYDTAGFVLGTGTQIVVSDTSATLSPLDSETTYDYYVTAICGGEAGESETIQGASFTTLAGPCLFNELVLSITTDQWGNETTWGVFDDLGTLVASGGPYSSIPDSGEVVQPDEIVCLENGCYDFVMFDSFGDGMCCDYGAGSYSLSFNGDVLASGDGTFLDADSTNFCLGGVDCSVYDTAPVDLTKSFDPVGGVQDRVQVKWFKASPEVRYSDADAAACDIKFWAKRNLDPVTGVPVGPAITNPDTILITDAKKSYPDNSPREIFKWPVKFSATGANNNKRADPNIRYEWQVRCACEHGAGVESPWSAVKIFNTPDFDPATGIYTPPGGVIDENGEVKSITAGAELSIYPNPVSGDEINLILNGLEDHQGMALVSLRDVTGKLVYSESVAVKGSSLNQRIQFENDLGEGLYMLSIELGNVVYHDRLMVK